MEQVASIRKARWRLAKSFRVSADKQGHHKIRMQHLDADAVIREHENTQYFIWTVHAKSIN